MSSKTAIANLAISHLGVGKEIANVDTENSPEARAVRRFFDEARDAALRDFDWPFSAKFQALGLVEEDPTDEWQFSYRYPSDAEKVRRICSGMRTDNRQSRISYKIVRDDSGLLIYTDQEDAIAEYSVRETDTSRWPPDFVLAMSYRLASLIAPRLTQGDPHRLGLRALQLYQVELGKAMSAAANEEQPDEPPESEFVRTRE